MRDRLLVVPAAARCDLGRRRGARRRLWHPAGITATGEFDYAHRRGVLQMGGALGDAGSPDVSVPKSASLGGVTNSRLWVAMVRAGAASARSWLLCAMLDGSNGISNGGFLAVGVQARLKGLPD